MHGQVHQDEVGPDRGGPAGGALAAVAAAVVHDPEDPAGRGVGLLGHDLGGEPAERFDAGGGLAAAEDFGAVDVPGGQVLQRPATAVFELDPAGAAGRGGQGGVAAQAGLDGGLLVGGDHVVASAERLAFPFSRVQVQHAGGLGLEVRVAGEDPRPDPPRLDGILGQPPPDGGARDLGHDPAADHLGGNVRHVQPRQRHAQPRRQFAGQGLDRDHHLRGERPEGGPLNADTHVTYGDRR